jgi:peptidoglycan/xylan/chitin deacetylase (PgdA/CDA1 family)
MPAVAPASPSCVSFRGARVSERLPAFALPPFSPGITPVAALAGAGAVLAASWAVRGRSSRFFAPSVWRGPAGRHSIALTFDDGPSPHTPAILEILAAHHIPATFFQIGANVRRNSDLAREVTQSGHEIGNHSFTHPNFALRPANFIHDEFARAQDALSDATGVTPTLMRAPYGVRWFGFRQMQQQLGLLGVMWTAIGRDWKLPAPAIAARVLAQACDGAIICLHDGSGVSPNSDRRATVEALRRIVPTLLQRGYRFETVSQLICPTTN